jgi:hypothetical protein
VVGQLSVAWGAALALHHAPCGRTSTRSRRSRPASR